METQNRLRKRIAVGLYTILFGTIAHAQPGYYIEKIDIPGTLTANTTAHINNSGQIIVENANDTISGNTHYLIESDGSITLFNDIDIRNFGDNGQVVGTCYIPEKRACLWDKLNSYSYIEGGTHQGIYYEAVEARDINTNGQVVGIASTGGWNAYAYTWDSINGTQIHTQGWGNSIANNGAVHIDASTGSEIWLNGQMIHQASGISYVMGLNHRPDAAPTEPSYTGYSTYYVWDDIAGTQAYPGNFIGSSVASAINKDNQIVGTYRYTSGASLWDNGEAFNLKDLLLDTNSGWSLSSAHDNNDAGQIIGRGVLNGEDSLFLLTREPIAEPTTVGSNYSISTIDVPGLEGASVTNINNQGDILGRTAEGATFFYSQQHGLTTPPNYITGVMSNRGDLAGKFASAPQFQVTFIWAPDLGRIDLGGSGAVTDFNDNGQAVGSCYGCGNSLWNYLEDRYGGNFQIILPIQPKGVNNNSVVVGHKYESVNGSLIYMPYLYDTTTDQLTALPQAPIPLANPNYYGPGTRYAINDNQMVAISDEVDAAIGNCAIRCVAVYANGSWSVLPSLADMKASGLGDISESGIVIGSSVDQSGQARAVMWKDNEVIDLNSLIDPTSGWLLTSARTILNDGRILATGELNGVATSVILTPGSSIDVCPSGCPHTSIQAAIDATYYRGTITVGDGTYNEAITLNKEKTLRSVNGPAVTTINGAGLNTSVVKMSVDSTLDGFTITGGYATNGGGIFAADYATVNNVTVTGNSASNGGGIYVAGTLQLDNSTLSNNSAGRGGALYQPNSSHSTLKNNRVENNSAAYGGGIYLANNGSISMEKGQITGNSASAAGGGLYLYIAGGNTATINNSLIANNSGGWRGADGIYSRRDITINNSTITANSASNSSGVFIYYGYTAEMVNSILWGNGSQNLSGTLNSSYSITDQVGTGNINADPIFVDAANGNFRLQATSPAIDSGSDTSAIGIVNDLEGTPRPQDGDNNGAGGSGDGSDYDMGAYEFKL